MGHDCDGALRHLDEHGWAVLPAVLSPAEVAAHRRASEVIPIFKHLSDFGGDEGLFVSHAHNLLGKTRAFDELTLHPVMLALAEGHLGANIQLNIAALLDTVPGQAGQRFHQDDGSWPITRPHQPLVCNFAFALDPFTEDVGGTRLVPGSHRLLRPLSQESCASQSISIAMEAGSLLVWTGATWHAGGANTSPDRSRRAINFNFSLEWLRQEENQSLAVPHDAVIGMPPRLQQLLGYTEAGWSLDFRPALDAIRENVARGRGHPGVRSELARSRSSRFAGVAYPARLEVPRALVAAAPRSAVVGSAAIASFAADGFVVIRALFSPAEVALIKRTGEVDPRTAAARDGKAQGRSKIWVADERRGLQPDKPDVYSAVFHSQRLVEATEALLGHEVYLYHYKLVLKDALNYEAAAPDAGNSWAWHQDYGYWYDDPNRLFPDMASVSIALDPATQRNGCLEFLRGSNRLERLEHLRTAEYSETTYEMEADPARVRVRSPRLCFSSSSASDRAIRVCVLQLAQEAGLEVVPCVLEPGDAVFWHANTLHRSAPNESPGNPRWSFICAYNALSNTPKREADGEEGGATVDPFHRKLQMWDDGLLLRLGQTRLAAAL
jgi:ectoine hydroxylase-related dioxygenase (phytanoyl-CoA dioxygenase family)